MHNALPAPLDILGIRYPWSELSPALAGDSQQRGIQNPLLSDQTEIFIPGMHFAREEVRRGRIPLWTPTEMGGAPFLANDQSAVLYPPNLLAAALPLTIAIQVLWMIRPFGVGLGMYFFLCAIGLRRPAAFVGAVAFMFSSFFVVWLGWSLPAVATWLPWSLLGAEKLLQGDRTWTRWVALLAFATGAHLLAGHIETSAHVFLAFSVYTTCRLIWTVGTERRDVRTIARRAIFVGAGTVLGIALAAAQLLPTAWYLFRHSYTYSVRQHTPPFPPLPLSDLAFWFVPNIVGNPAYAALGHNFADGFSNYNERVGYCGVVTLVLATLSFVHPCPARRPYRSALVGVLLVAGGVVYGLPPIRDLAVHLPVLALADNFRLTFVMAFALAALAALGFDGMVARLESLRSSWRDGLTILDVACILGTATFALGAAVVSKRQVITVILHTAQGQLPLSAATWANAWVFFSVALVAACVALVRLLTIGAIEPHVGLAAVALLLIGDLFAFGATYNPSVSARYLYPPTPLSETIHALGPDARYIAPLNLFPANFGQWYDFRTLDAYEGIVLERAHNFLRAIDRNGPDSGDWTHVGANEAPDYRLLAIGDVTHVLLLTSEAEPEGMGGHLVLQHEDVGDAALPPLTAGEEEAQIFTAPTDDIAGIGFTLGTGQQPATRSLTFRLADVATGAALVTRDVSTVGVQEQGLLTIPFPPLGNSRGRRYRASLAASGENAGGAMPVLYGSEAATLAGGQRLRDGHPAPGSLRMRLYQATANSGVTPVWRGGSGTLYAVDDARPRAYIAEGILDAPDSDTALAALDRLHVPGRDAVIESRQSLSSTGGVATILRDEPGDITIRVQAGTPGLLVLNEGFGDGGWQVAVDGKRATDLHANYLYQGVAIPAGEHSVHFRYRPRSFTIGAAISLTAGIAILILLATPTLARFARRRYRHHAHGASPTA